VDRIESHEGSSVFLAQNPHEGGKSFAGVPRSKSILQHHRESHRMDPNASGTVTGGLIDPIHLIDDRLDGGAAEFVTENIQAYFLFPA